jgi:hypothetical protein
MGTGDACVVAPVIVVTSRLALTISATDELHKLRRGSTAAA